MSLRCRRRALASKERDTNGGDVKSPRCGRNWMSRGGREERRTSGEWRLMAHARWSGSNRISVCVSFRSAAVSPIGVDGGLSGNRIESIANGVAERMNEWRRVAPMRTA